MIICSSSERFGEPSSLTLTFSLKVPVAPGIQLKAPPELMLAPEGTLHCSVPVQPVPFSSEKVTLLAGKSASVA
jgi:hypothetical protein